MNVTKRAVEAYENQEYDTAFSLFKEAVEQERTVATLTNLAWYYAHEKDDFEQTVKLAKEAISLEPNLHFSYSLLGETYVRMGKWKKAAGILPDALARGAGDESRYNLGVTHYKQGQYKIAAHYFNGVSNEQPYARYAEAYTHLKAGNVDAAKETITRIPVGEGEEIYQADLADLYLEVGDLADSLHWFGETWKTYAKSPSWVSRYAYLLTKLNQSNQAKTMLDLCITDVKEEWQETKEAVEEPGYWEPGEKEEFLNDLQKEIQEYQTLLSRMEEGYVPSMDFDLSFLTKCHLYGCTHHGHKEID